MINHVEIQLQDEIGNWRTTAVTINESAVIRARMSEVEQQFPNRRIRAIDREGRIVDLI